MAIPIPNLPTDNLYKFLALSGVFVFCLFAWMAQNTARNIVDLKAEIIAQQNQAEAIKALLPPNRNIKSPNDAADTQLFLEWVEKVKAIEIKQSKLKNKQSWAISFFLSFVMIILISAFTAFKGFTLWFERVQKAQDEMLQLNLEEARFKASNLKKSPPST